jgi:hypothetical protein
MLVVEFKQRANNKISGKTEQVKTKTEYHGPYSGLSIL